MSSLEQVKKFRQEMYDRSMALVQKKGADYNRDQQQAGDTLFNLRVCELMGVVPTAERGILVRLTDKLMRLISLVHPDREPAVTDESVLDTICDIHNYVDYLGLMHQERRTMPNLTITTTVAGPVPDALDGTIPVEAALSLDDVKEKLSDVDWVKLLRKLLEYLEKRENRNSATTHQ